MMNDLAEAMREAAEILHEIGGYSALVDDLRYGADELEGDAERCKHGIRLPHECGECQNSVDTEAAVAWYAYESVAAILEPHMGRNGRDGILPASVTDAVQILLEHRLRHPPTERAVPEGWKPIETAPKDGTTVLLRSKYGSHGDGYWLQSARDGLGAWVWPYLRNEPWFWMPLPAAPRGDSHHE